MIKKKFVQIRVDPDLWVKWVALAKSNGTPLVTYIKLLISKELAKMK